MTTFLRLLAASLLFFWGPALSHAGPSIAVLHTQPYVYTINPAGDIYVNYRFRAQAPTAVSQHVFVHFLDADGKIAFQDDHVPPAATTQWYGDIVYERHLTVPARIPAGHYRIAVGLYERATGRRTALTTVVDAAGTEPTYTVEERPGSSRYVVGEVYITAKQIVEPPFACNGNDVTAALSQAFRALSSGQVLKLPFGQCHYAGMHGVNAMRLDQRSDIEVVGQGAPSTRLIATDKYRSGVIVSGSNGILLRDFRIEVARAPGNSERTGYPDATGVYVENSAHVELRQLALVSPLAQGISFYRAHDSRATRNFVKLSAADGIHAAGPSSNITFDHNETFDVGDDGLSSIGYSAGPYAGPNHNIAIQNNRVRFQHVKWGSGIAVEGTAVAKVLDNYIERSGSAGIRIASIEGYALLQGVRHPFLTGGVSSVEVAGNELVDVETRADLDQGAIHLAAMAADVSDVHIHANTISSASLAGTTTDAIRLVGRVTRDRVHFVRDVYIWNNTVNNTFPGILGEWCIGGASAATENLGLNSNMQGQVLPNVYNNIPPDAASRKIDNKNCTRRNDK